MDRPRLLLADDHPGTRQLLYDILATEFDVVGQVEDGLALVSAAARLSPDAVVSDISMPGLDGIAAASAILGRDRAARIVLVTVHRDPVLVDRAREVGALGYVLKLAAGDDLLPAVGAALRGEPYVSSALRLPPRIPGRNVYEKAEV